MSSSWALQPLGQLCDVLDSKRRPVTKRDRIAGPYPYYGATGIQDYVAEWIFDEPLVLVGEDGAKWGSGDSSAFSIEGKTWVNNHAHVLRPHRDKALDKWLIFYLNHTDLTHFVSGMTVPKLNQENLRRIPVPIPLLPEQQRIVGILDQAFEGITKAKANAERNLANAKELYANAFNDLLALRCQDAPMAPLDTIADFKNGLNFNRSSKGEVIKIVGVANFKDNFWTPDELDEVQIEGSLSGAYELRDNDILVVRSNGNKELIGRCILARGVKGKTSHSGFTIRVRPHSDAVDSEYLTHFMKSSAVRRDLVASGDGANISSLNQKALSSIIVPLPHVSVQRDIVNDLSVLGDKISQLTACMVQKSSAVDELRQSVLHQAFSRNL